MNPVNGRISPARLDGQKAKVGDLLQWDGARWVPVTLPVGGLHVGTAAPTDGSVFWYDTDATC